MTALPNWSGQKKQAARLKTIIEPARQMFGQKLPPNKQYWTMCSKCGTNGNLDQGSEFDQLIQSGLITPQQFFGVEKDSKIHNNNIGLPGNWINDDFYWAMRSAAANNDFSPGIVNVDTMFLPKIGARFFTDIFTLLSELNINNIILICNFVLRSAYHRDLKTGEDILEELNKHKLFLKYLSYWDTFNQIYMEYDGADNKSTAVMGTVLFSR